jgi:hypothetical protein
LIKRLKEIFRDVTGRPPTGRSLFQKFVRRILISLPRTVYNPNVEDGALPRRIQRLRSTK